MKIELIGVVDFEKEEGECARIAEISDDNSEFFVRLQSYDQEGKHPTADQLQGKKIKITIEDLT